MDNIGEQIERERQAHFQEMRKRGIDNKKAQEIEYILEDPIFDILENYLPGKMKLSTEQILKENFPGQRDRINLTRRVSKIMRYLKWVKGVYRFPDGKTKNGYYWPGLTAFK